MLASLHVGVEVGVESGVVLVVVAAAAFLVFILLVDLLAAQPLEEVGHLGIVERVGEVLRHALEASEASVAVLGAVADVGACAHGVGFVGVGGEGGVEVEGVALGELQSEARTEVAPGSRLGGEVVGHGGTEFVDDADFLEACGVVVAFDFHLDVVGDVHGDATGLALAHGAEDGALEVVVLDERDVAVGVGLLVGVEVAVARGAEVGRVAEGDGGREDVAYAVNLVAEEFAVGYEEAVDLGGESEAHVPVVDVVESLQRVDDFLLSLFVPGALVLLGVHAVGEVERGVDVEEVEEREVAADGDVVLHAVAPVLGEAGVHEFVLLGADFVFELSGIADGDFLVPALVADGLLALEGVEVGHGDVEVGQRERYGGVAHVLVEVEGGGQRHAQAGELGAPGDGTGARGLGVGLGVVHGRQVVALVAAGGEVDAGAQRAVGIGLGVLGVLPEHLETGGLGVVGHVFVALYGVLVADEQGAVIAVALAVVGGGGESPGAFGVDFAHELQVHLVADGKVVAAVAQVEAARGLVAVGRHDETAGVALGEGEEAVGDGKGQRHVGHYQVGGSEDDILARPHLGARHGEVEVGVRLVAGGVAAVVEVHVALAVALGEFGGHVAVLLLGVDVVDESLLGLEVEGHGVGLVGVGAHFEDGCAKLASRGINGACGMHQAGVQRHVDLVALEVHVLVLHVRLAKEVGHAGDAVVGHGVGGGVLHGGVDAVLALAVQGVGGQGVVDGLVALPDEQLQGVHGRRVGQQALSRVADQRVAGCSVGGQGVAGCSVSGQGVSRQSPRLLLCKAQPRDFRHHENDDEKQQKYERFSSHGCKGTKKLRVKS